ncbi:uncharacterized protein LOC106156208 [Lingula anatina]|uniref:Uncharacterized protein LOC106156208 n=1 Tax=Lingula anatina TaxID=7574 RepID=A0A1S3HL06_LINAN|nr:uncharacterized protein LOC106156208 [Lingula anatina]|eukprot:XP_013386788.1 uncharacterized protein LOC106156208 [Lingula anatina]
MSQSQQTSQSQSSLTRPEKRPKLDERGNVGMEQSKSTSTEGESPLPDYNLPCHILEEIVLKLSDLKDVLRCLRVCKTWSRILNRVSFWKRYVQSHYDLEAADDPSSDEVLANWQGDRFFIYFVEEGNPEYYVFKPFPVLLKCGIIVGSGFKLPDGDTGQHFATLTIAVDKLLTLKKKSAKFECNVMAYGNEGDGPHAIWLMPWNDSGMPSGKEVFIQEKS